MGKVCVCGASALHIDYAAKTLTVGGQTFKEGDFLSIDGTSGTVYAGEVKTAPREVVQGLVQTTRQPKRAAPIKNFAQLMKWCSQGDPHARAHERRQPGADRATPSRFGATGIGLCRTEHMFFEGDRIYAMREMILAENIEDRKEALAKLLPYQREDFTGIFTALKGLPATIRFLDPPLHEFLPHDDATQQRPGRENGHAAGENPQRVNELHEFNPMLGFRGCRLGIGYPEISEMQAAPCSRPPPSAKERH